MELSHHVDRLFFTFKVGIDDYMWQEFVCFNATFKWKVCVMKVRLHVFYSCHPSSLLWLPPCISLSFNLLLSHLQFSLRCELLLLMKMTAFQSSSSPFTARMVYRKLWQQQPLCCKVRHPGKSQKTHFVSHPKPLSMIKLPLVCPGQHHRVHIFIFVLRKHKMTLSYTNPLPPPQSISHCFSIVRTCKGNWRCTLLFSLAFVSSNNHKQSTKGSCFCVI